MQTDLLKIIPFLLIINSCRTQQPCCLLKNIEQVVTGIIVNKYCILNQSKIKYVLIDNIIMNVDENSEEVRQLLCMRNDILIHTIDVPNSLDCSGFSINWIKKNRQGFEISIEYGTVNYWHKIFYFIYINESFYLYKIESGTFNKNSPELYYKQSDTVNLLPINKFSITNYCD
jgi:hypothetical protein